MRKVMPFPLVWNSSERRSDGSDGGTLLDRLESARKCNGSDDAKHYGVGLRMKVFWSLCDDAVLLAVCPRNRSAVAAMVSVGGRLDTDDNRVCVGTIDRCSYAGCGKRTQQHHGRDKDVDQ